MLACAVVVSFAAWLYGIAQRRRFIGRSWKALLAVTVALLVAAITPLPGVMQAQPEAAEPAVASTAAPVKWTPQTVEEMRGHGKAIFVNFTASWCITCQVNDRTSLSTAAVKEALSRTGTIYMVADSTKFNADIDDAMTAFGQGGLPLYVVYPADGSEPKVLPQVLTPSIVVNALDRASGKKA
jgi:thiol:disulfide interchange protein DsbD